MTYGRLVSYRENSIGFALSRSDRHCCLALRLWLPGVNKPGQDSWSITPGSGGTLVTLGIYSGGRPGTALDNTWVLKSAINRFNA